MQVAPSSGELGRDLLSTFVPSGNGRNGRRGLQPVPNWVPRRGMVDRRQDVVWGESDRHAD